MTLKEAIEALRCAGIDSPEHDARELFRKFAGHPSPIIPSDASTDKTDFINAVARRVSREPLQYIIGEVGFYREEYKVNPCCLIPRSDTEILVDYAVRHIPTGERFADLCAGSGCIGISTLANTTDTSCVSVDISADALGLTRYNAQINKVSGRLEALELDLLSNEATLPGKFFAILSNPPYVTEEVYETLEREIFHEPKIAFVGKRDGMEFYEKLLPLSLKHLKDDGFIAFEIGYDQADKISSLASAHGCTCDIIKDFSGNDRVAIMKSAKLK